MNIQFLDHTLTSRKLNRTLFLLNKFQTLNGTNFEPTNKYLMHLNQIDPIQSPKNGILILSTRKLAKLNIPKDDLKRILQKEENCTSYIISRKDYTTIINYIKQSEEDFKDLQILLRQAIKFKSDYITLQRQLDIP